MNWRIILLACLLMLSACKKDTTDVPIAGSITESVGESTTAEPEEVAPEVAPAQTCDAECEKACADVRPAFAKDCPAAYNVGCFDGTAPAGFPCDSFTQQDTKPKSEEDAPGARPASQERGIEKGDEAPKMLKRVAPAAKKKSAKGKGSSGDSPDFKPTPIGD